MATVDDLLAKRPALRPIYDRLVAVAETLGPVEQDPKKTSIHLNRTTAFAGVALRKDCLVLTLKSDRPLKHKRVFRSQQTSKTRWHHEVKLANIQDVDAELKAWLKAAYRLSE